MKTRPLMMPLAASLLVIAGCQSLDPASDQSRAAETVSSRLGPAVTADWPGLDASAEWDGRADLSADAAVRCALAAHPEIRIAMDRIAAARADWVQSGLLPNPVLNVSLGFPLGGEDGATSVGVGLVQQLAWLLTQHSRREAAAADLSAEVIAASDQALTLASEVRKLHARIAFAQRLQREHAAAADNADRAAELGRRAAAAGEASTLEVNRRAARLIELQIAAATAQSELDVLKRELLQLLGRADADVTWSAAEPAGLAWSPDWSESAIIDLVRRQRLDVAAAMTRAESARVRAGLAKSDVWSDLEAGAAFSRDEDAREELGPEISVPLPIFDTGAARTARAAAEARIAAAEAAEILGRAIAEARTAWVRAQSARTLVESSAPPLVQSADQSLELSRRAFAAGALELTGLLAAEEDAVNARIRQLELERDAVIERLELERAVGGLLAP